MSSLSSVFCKLLAAVASISSVQANTGQLDQVNAVCVKEVRYPAPLCRGGLPPSPSGATYALLIRQEGAQPFQGTLKLDGFSFEAPCPLDKKFRASFGIIIPQGGGSASVKTGDLRFDRFEGPISNVTMRNPFLRIVLRSVIIHSCPLPFGGVQNPRGLAGCEKVIEVPCSSAPVATVGSPRRIGLPRRMEPAAIVGPSYKMWINLSQRNNGEEQVIDRWEALMGRQWKYERDKWISVGKAEADEIVTVLDQENENDLSLLEKVLKEKGSFSQDFFD